jgi:uncharacterized protein YjbI with pentapeptide repeats
MPQQSEQEQRRLPRARRQRTTCEQLKERLQENEPLTDLDLCRTDLSTIKDLSRRDLSCCSFADASLAGVKLERARLQSCVFARTDLHGTSLLGADLRNADLSSATGLTQDQFRGALLGCAKLPEGFSFEGLERVRDLVNRAERQLQVLLLSCTTVAVVAFATGHAQFFLTGGSLTLPGVNLTVRLSAFFVLAPLVLFGLYSTLSFTLRKLWLELANLPAQFPNGRAVHEQTAPSTPHFTAAAAMYVVDRIAGEEEKGRRFLAERQLMSFLAWWATPMTMLFFVWGAYLPRHAVASTFWHLLVTIGTAALGVVSYRQMDFILSGRFRDRKDAAIQRQKTTVLAWWVALLALLLLFWGLAGQGASTLEHGLAIAGTIVFGLAVYEPLGFVLSGQFRTAGRASPEWAGIKFLVWWVAVVMILLLLWDQSLSRAVGAKTVVRTMVTAAIAAVGVWMYRPLSRHILPTKQAAGITRTDTGARITMVPGFRIMRSAARSPAARPQRPHPLWAAARLLRMRAGTIGIPALGFALFLVSLVAMEGRGCRSVLLRSEEADTRCNYLAADLSHADLTGVRLPHVNLRRALLFHATMDSAQIEEANLRHANLIGVGLANANLKDANLDRAILWEAGMGDARLKEAEMSGADLRGAVLRGAEVQGVDFTDADLRGVDWMGALVCGANVGGARVDTVTLKQARGWRRVVGTPYAQRTDSLVFIGDQLISNLPGC